MYHFACSSDNTIAKTTLQFFSCTQVDEETRLVTTLPSLSCDSDEYKAVFPFFVVLMALVVIGFPVSLFIFLFISHRRGKLFSRKYVERVGTFVEVYQPKFFFYEVVILLRYHSCKN